MGRNNIEKQEYIDRCPNFDNHYQIFIQELLSLPNATKDEKERRFIWAKNREEYDDLVLDMMKICSPNAYSRIENRLKENAQGGVRDSGGDFDLAAKNYKNGMDPLILIESLKDVIGTYAGTNSQGERVLFSVCVLNRYKQISGNEVAAEVCSIGGINVGDLNKDSRLAVSKLLRALKEYKANNNEKKTEEIIDILIKESKHKYTKKELLATVALYEELELCNIYSNDSEGEERTLEIEAVEFGFERIENDKSWKEFLSELGEGIDREGKILYGYLGKVNMDILKAFLTKDILIALKLEPISKDEKGIKKEPGCKQWCNQRHICGQKKHETKQNIYKYEDKKCYGCVRYDTIYTAAPYGNLEVFELLKDASDTLYKNLLHKEYLSAALANADFYDVYYNPLYPHPDVLENKEDNSFEFSDTMLAKVLHKDKGQISNSRKKYEETSRNALYQLFLNKKL